MPEAARYESAIRDVCAACGYDLDDYVVVVSADSGVKNSNEVVSGLGITRRAMAFYHLYWAHALYGIAVVNGHTGKVMAWHGAPGG